MIGMLREASIAEFVYRGDLERVKEAVSKAVESMTVQEILRNAASCCREIK
ncbi:MAG: hypothetical protein ACXQS2_01690 [Methermicoccaceae archaeon]